jgi:hypothetical protein
MELPMPRLIEGEDRSQGVLFRERLDDYSGEDAAVLARACYWM